MNMQKDFSKPLWTPKILKAKIELETALNSGTATADQLKNRCMTLQKSLSADLTKIDPTLLPIADVAVSVLNKAIGELDNPERGYQAEMSMRDALNNIRAVA